MSSQIEFCLNCGLSLDPRHRHRSRPVDPAWAEKGFCNEKCSNAYERKQRPCNKPKYGVAGEIYL